MEENELTKCKNCNETIDFKSFDKCWNCGSDSDGNKDPQFVKQILNKTIKSYTALRIISVASRIIAWIYGISILFLIIYIYNPEKFGNQQMLLEFSLILGLPLHAPLISTVLLVIQSTFYILGLLGISELIQLLFELNLKANKNGK